MNKIIHLPVDEDTISQLKIKDKLLLTGTLYTGRDAALPQLINKIKTDKSPIPLKGSAIMHTAVSNAGISPTSSNKIEIEKSIPYLSEYGVKIHLGKGKLSDETINQLKLNNSIFAITPPVAALLTDKVESKKVVAFHNEGMEAIFELKVKELPCIVAVANGESIF